MVFANSATAELIGVEKVTVVNDGDNFAIGGFDVVARELPHCLLPDGNEGPQNTGYVIDGVLFHPGDGKEMEGLQVDNLALPITGPDISILDAINFAKQVKAKVAIPIHYTAIPADPDVFAAYAGKGNADFEVRVLADGESTEI
jgi:L-ascorbate metabolism protein UlaG (beta-lactamase superfamily)